MSLTIDFIFDTFSKKKCKYRILKFILYSKARQELNVEIKRQRAEGRARRQPEVTTKHGKLKSDRKAKPQKMYVDDLAALDMLTEVKLEDIC